jgi:hypothetical protein
MIGIGRRKVTNVLLAFLGNGRFLDGWGYDHDYLHLGGGGRRRQPQLCKVTTGLGRRLVFGVFFWDGMESYIPFFVNSIMVVVTNTDEAFSLTTSFVVDNSGNGF